MTRVSLDRTASTVQNTPFTGPIAPVVSMLRGPSNSSRYDLLLASHTSSAKNVE
jgi:hypothetical protein